MKKGLFQSKAFSLLLIVALLFCMAPQFAFTAYADESTSFEVISSECSEIGEYIYGPLYYCVAPEGTTEVVFKDVEGNMEEGMIIGLQAGEVRGTNVAPVSGEFRATWETMNTNDSIEFEEGAENLDYSNAYFYFIMDDDYETSSYIIQVTTPPAVDTAFTSNVGEISGPEEDAYSYVYYDPEQGWAPVDATADLYTLAVPYGTQEVTLDFGETKTISYNYDAEGNFLDGWYDDATIGETTTTKKVDCNDDGIPDYIWVQNPYNADYTGGEVLYVIKLEYSYTFTCSVDGEEMTKVSFTPDSYTYYDYMLGATSTVGTFTVAIPHGTEFVDLSFSNEVLCYNYDGEGNYLAGWYDDSTVGETETSKPVDSNNDGVMDYIQVQKPYNADWSGGDLLYTVTFKYDTDDVYEMLVEKAAKLMSDDANATYGKGDWFIFDQARDGREVNPNYLESVKSYINEHEGDLVGETPSYSNYARTILAVTALGVDPRTFTDYDLFAPIADMKNLEALGLNAYIWALIALDSHDYTPPMVEGLSEEDFASRDNLYEYIIDAAIEGGGWALTGTTPDVDITAMALASLAYYYDENDEIKAAVDAAVEWLSEVQNADGTFNALNPNGTTTPTCESTAMAVIALSTLGIDPSSDERFVKDGNSAIDGLCSFAVLEGNNPGMKHISSGPVDTMATEQAYRAFVAFKRMENKQFDLYDLLDQMILARVYGPTRYETSLEVAERYMKNNFLTELDSVIIATGDDFPDALSGSSLSIMNEAPVILISNKVQKSRDDATAFIKENLAEGGNVFIIGGESVVSKEYADSLTGLGYEVTRYAGNSRFDTNLQILDAVGESDYLLVCSGLNYADAATASATALPVLLVGKKLEASQLEYLKSAGKKEIYVIGGPGAVADDIADALAEYDSDGTVQRVAGKDRALTAKAVAEEFFDLKPYISTVVFAYGGNFPDCISGGLLAYTLDAPILYGGSHQTYTDAAAPYVQNNVVKTAYILGGPTLISDEFVFGLEE